MFSMVLKRIQEKGNTGTVDGPFTCKDFWNCCFVRFDLFSFGFTEFGFLFESWLMPSLRWAFVEGNDFLGVFIGGVFIPICT